MGRKKGFGNPLLHTKRKDNPRRGGPLYPTGAKACDARRVPDTLPKLRWRRSMVTFALAAVVEEPFVLETRRRQRLDRSTPGGTLLELGVGASEGVLDLGPPWHP